MHARCTLGLCQGHARSMPQKHARSMPGARQEQARSMPDACPQHARCTARAYQKHAGSTPGVRQMHAGCTLGLCQGHARSIPEARQEHACGPIHTHDAKAKHRFPMSKPARRAGISNVRTHVPTGPSSFRFFWREPRLADQKHNLLMQIAECST